MNVAGTGMRVVVATRPVDFRKGHDKLASVVEHELGLDPYSGVAVVFRPKALRAIAAHQVNLVHFLDLLEGDRVNMARIEAAAEQWSLPGGRRCSQPALAVARQRFVGHAVRWLRFVNLLEGPCKARHAQSMLDVDARQRVGEQPPFERALVERLR